MPTFSIIVPMYNSEAHLKTCLDSIQAQTFTDFEVICVDDGSTDSSAGLARTYETSDHRFRVLGKANGGPSSARNHGIEHATGDVVLFVDSDDRIKPDCCERIARAFAETDAQIVIFGIAIESAFPVDPWYERVCSPPEAVFDSFSAELMFSEFATPYAVRNAIKRELLCKTGVRFAENVSLGEDAMIQFALFPRASKVAAIPDKLYCYDIDREDSLCHSQDEDRKRLTAHRDVIEGVFEDWNGLGILPKYACELFTWSKPFVLRGIERLDGNWRYDHLCKVGAIWKRYFDLETALKCSDSIEEEALLDALFADELTRAGLDRRSRRMLWKLELDSLPVAEHDPLRIRIDTLYHDNEKLYLECRIDSSASFSGLECEALANRLPAPVEACPLDVAERGASQTWVLVLPWLAAPSINVALRPDGHAARQKTFTISYRRAKWLSWLNYRAKTARCTQIREQGQSLASSGRSAFAPENG